MKIDITKLEGYSDTLTAEQKLELITKHEIPDPDLTGYVKKDTLDRTASEAADWKKKYNSKLSEDEKKEEERKTLDAAKDAELDALRKKDTISTHRAELLGIGYDDKLATETAKALADGDMAKFFANQKIHDDAVRKAALAGALASGKEPPAGRNEEPNKRADLQKQYDVAIKEGKTAEAVSLKNAMFALDNEQK